MIGWLQPSALWGLGLLAVPVAIHLLRPRHARCVPFPAVRFVRPSRTASVRFRPPSDRRLLAIRLLIVAAAVAAAAQPVWVSGWRLAAWDARTARAIVVETGPDGAMTEAVRAMADAEASGPLSHRIEHPDLREGVRRASAWLKIAPPARREIVVIAPFRLGTFGTDAFAAIDPAIGLRFVPVALEQEQAELDRVRLLAAPGRSPGAQRTFISSEGTSTSIEPPSASVDVTSGGFRVLGDDGPATANRLSATLAAAGVPVPDPAQPVALAFGEGLPPAGAHARFERWMIETLAGIERSPELRRLARGVTAVTTRDDSTPFTTVIVDSQGNPLVRAAAVNGELMLHAAVAPSSYFAAALARTALVARHGPVAQPEREVLTIPRHTLQVWSRVPGPVAPDAWRQSDTSDAHWLWTLALILLGVETWMRAPRRIQVEEPRAAA